MITIYGIPTCDTVRKARKWLDAHGIGHHFHDLRADGLDPALLDAWIARFGWERVLNRASATFRALPEGERAGLDAPRARALLLANPVLVKRPVLAHGESVLIGFTPAEYAARLA